MKKRKIQIVVLNDKVPAELKHRLVLLDGVDILEGKKVYSYGVKNLLNEIPKEFIESFTEEEA